MAPQIILVTGGSGLVGKAIKKVINDKKTPFFNSREEDTWVFLSSKDVDLTNYNLTKKMFESIKPTKVIHLAAMVGGLYKNMKYQVDFFNDNMAINSSILKCSYEAKVEKLVCCLSTCIFPDKTNYPINETMLHNGPPHSSNEGYAYAKRMLEVQCRLYNRQYGCNFITVIPTNVFGPNDNYNLDDSHVIPGLIHKCYLASKEGSDFVVWGTGTPLRQFIYSYDLAKLIIWALEEYNQLDPIILSVSESDELSIRHVALEIAKAMKFQGEVRFDSSKNDGQFKKTADNKKLLELIGNEFKFTSFTKAIEKSVSWFIKHYSIARK